MKTMKTNSERGMISNERIIRSNQTTQRKVPFCFLLISSLYINKAPFLPFFLFLTLASARLVCWLDDCWHYIFYRIMKKKEKSFFIAIHKDPLFSLAFYLTIVESFSFLFNINFLPFKLLTFFSSSSFLFIRHHQRLSLLFSFAINTLISNWCCLLFVPIFTSKSWRKTSNYDFPSFSRVICSESLSSTGCDSNFGRLFKEVFFSCWWKNEIVKDTFVGLSYKNVSFYVGFVRKWC